MCLPPSMLVVLAAFAFAFHLKNIQGINLNNNACTRIEDYYLLHTSKNCYHNPNVMSNTPSMIAQNGYKIEIYTVVTEDGYILTLFRIPAKDPEKHKAKQAIFLQHGIAASSSYFVCYGNTSTAFFLHEVGYDVWLGNFRGTPYSQDHLTLNKTEEDFWNFSIDSNALYDVRSMIRFVANATGHKIIYLGHSMGSTAIFMYCSTFPRECEDNIQGIIALSPIAYLASESGFGELLNTDSLIYLIAESLLRTRILAAHSETVHNLSQYICTAAPYACRILVDLAFGITNQFRPEHLLVLFSYYPDPIVLKQFLQYAQIYSSNALKRFDYGHDGNMKIYGQNYPPLYDLGRIKLPTFMFYGKGDPLINRESVTRLFRELGGTKKFLKVIPKNNEKYRFNHADFIDAKYLSEFFYPELTSVLENEFTAVKIRKQ